MGALSTPALARALVGRLTGVVRRLDEVPPVADGPRTRLAAAEVAVPAGGGLSRILSCGGAGATPDEAHRRALGEAVERYCAARVPNGALTRARWRDLCDRATRPGGFTLFAARQHAQPGFPYAPFTEDAEVDWVPVWSLTERRERLAPAAFVFLRHDQHSPVAPGLSTGLACHETPARAALAGLLEAVERDAFTASWLARRPVPRLAADGRALHPDLVPAGASCNLFDLTSDVGAPVALALLRGRSEVGPTSVVGARADVGFAEAVLGAMREAALSWTYAVRIMEREPAWVPGSRFERVVDFRDHARLYTACPELADEAFAFLFEGPSVERSAARDLAAAAPLDDLVARLAAVGVEALVRDLTTPDVASVGLSVVRAVGVGLLPLHGHHGLPFLGPGRLWSAPEHYPGCAAPPTLETLNPFPHPSG